MATLMGQWTEVTPSAVLRESAGRALLFYTIKGQVLQYDTIF
jgi:hypothetical protein